ncbi:hypothetical protein ACX0G9_30550 [Flavitalea flava]
MNNNGNIPFARKFLISALTSLVCSMTVLRIVTRLAFEGGVNPANTPAPIAAVIPAGIIFLSGLLFPFFWNKVSGPGDLLRSLLCYGIALDLAMIGLQKWFGLQAHTPIALLDGPFSGFSGEDLSWAYFGRSPAFLNVIGGFQILGSLFLVFPRTRLVGVFALLPVMLNICLMNCFYHFYPGEIGHAVILLLGLLYLLLEEKERLLPFFFLSAGPSGIMINTIRLSVVIIPLLLILCFFHLPHRDPEIYGKYQVTSMWTNDKAIHQGDCKDSVLTNVFIDENNDCVFAYNSLERLVLGTYKYDRASSHMQVVWRFPPVVHDTLDARLKHTPDGLTLDGRMGQSLVRMELKKIIN